jgi:23S rRNA (uracil1939-C5)-methyltransferase
MEYSFTSDKNGKISLAFFKRGTHRLIPIDFCKLAVPEINKVAKKIVIWLNQNSVPLEILKSIVLRTNNKEQVIAGLFIKENFSFKNYPPLQNPLIGFHIYFSNPLSPASVVDEELFKEGQNFLDVNIRETTLKYGLLSFFQVNLPLFEIVLNDISRFLDPKKSLIDYYSGVGAISIPLNSYYKDCILIDSEQEAINFALENIKTNNLEDKCKVLKSLVEKATQLIEKNKIILFDPPRAGLHKKIIKKILIEKPVRIVYLSCNLSTQARDIQLLQSEYKVKFLRLYNFFPRTPHIEGLCVLDRK